MTFKPRSGPREHSVGLEQDGSEEQIIKGGRTPGVWGVIGASASLVGVQESWSLKSRRGRPRNHNLHLRDETAAYKGCTW